MKRTLIVAACSTLFLGAAHAEYSIYGLLDGSLGKSISDAQAKDRVGFHSGGDNGSGEGNSTTRVGIKGTNDIGSGIKANFKFETGGIGSDGKVNNNGTFFNRQAWFGASGSFGELRFGRQDSVPFQTFIDFDYNGASNGVSAAAYSGAGLWAWLPRQSHSLQYITPAVGGAKGQFGLQLKDNTVGAKDVVSGGLSYATGGLSLAASFQTKDATGGHDYVGVAGGYDFGIVKATVGYHDMKVQKGITVGVQATVAGTAIGAIYAKETKDPANKKGSVIELFVNKEVLKGTYAYAEMGIADKNVIGGKGTGYAVGVIYTF
jgi:predicted porin